MSLMLNRLLEPPAKALWKEGHERHSSTRALVKRLTTEKPLVEDRPRLFIPIGRSKSNSPVNYLHRPRT